MLNILSWILTGLVVGVIARAMVPGKQALSWVWTIVLGIVGAFVGGLISSFIWPTWNTDPSVSTMWPGWIMSVIGGVIVLVAFLAITRQRNITA